MNRRRFVQQFGMGTLAATAAHPVSLRAAEGLAEPGVSLASTPMTLQAPRPDGVEAVWGVRARALGRIEWEGPDGARGVAASDAHGFVPQGTRSVRVRIDGWIPGREYRLRPVTVAAEGESRVETGDWRTFRTLDPAAPATRFAVWNDTHVNQTTLERLDEVTPASDFLIWNGDTCNDWHREDDLVPILLNPGGRDITRNRPLHVVWGNHDVRGPWAFRVPDVVASPSGRPFHAFRSGPLAAVCLHTGEDKPDDHPSFRGRVAFDPLRQEQAAWLNDVLRRPEFASAPYRLVFCHIPLRWIDERPQDYAGTGFDRHSGRSRAAWHDALVRWGVQAIISGHTHRAAWMPPTDVFPYGQLIGGGPQPASATWIEGVANPQSLRLTVRNLAGDILHDVSLPAL
ncbi:MAG: metallophosphoesterase [Verrucomicrobiae bacterium]|nr:metallophosphoesterase [Verrucomicrobiae bacterium]